MPSHNPAFNSRGFNGWADTLMDNKMQSHAIIAKSDFFNDFHIFIDY